MIPYAIFSAKLYIDNKGKSGTQTRSERALEIRALEMSVEGFTFRVSVDVPIECIESAGKVCLHFYRIDNAGYAECVLERNVINKQNMTEVSFFEIHIVDEGSTEFYHIYRLSTENHEYQSCANKLMHEYLNYIDLKLNNSDAHLSEELTGYPSAQEELYADSFAAQRKKWFTHFDGNEWSNVDTDCFELGVCIDNTKYYEKYLEMSVNEFMDYYWAENGFCINAHPITNKKPSFLYIGNQFCHLLFPKPQILFSILEKALREEIKPVIVFTYMQEHYITEMKERLAELRTWCSTQKQRLELVVNDWGMLSMLANHEDDNRNALSMTAAQNDGMYQDCFDITLGILLNKRRKDTRLPYKKGAEKLLCENALYSRQYCRYLKEHYRVSRVSQEACRYDYEVSAEALKSTLYFPFYQMNTSQHCTLYADIKNGNRGRQCAVAQCPEYCREQAFLYPEMLNMAGRYNTLFGYDTNIMYDGNIINQLIKQGVDRLVVYLI